MDLSRSGPPVTGAALVELLEAEIELRLDLLPRAYPELQPDIVRENLAAAVGHLTDAAQLVDADYDAAREAVLRAASCDWSVTSALADAFDFGPCDYRSLDEDRGAAMAAHRTSSVVRALVAGIENSDLPRIAREARHFARQFSFFESRGLLRNRIAIVDAPDAEFGLWQWLIDIDAGAAHDRATLTSRWENSTAIPMIALTAPLRAPVCRGPRTRARSRRRRAAMRSSSASGDSPDGSSDPASSRGAA